jgi:ABC-2 type transport system ATP-binding protein/ribosome-dependent ATPase
MQGAEQCDRLLLMSSGQLIATGSQTEIIGSTTAVAVNTADWSAAFVALNAAGAPVMLAGRSVRIANGDPNNVQRILTESGIAATVHVVPATIEERMLVLARQPARPD